MFKIPLGFEFGIDGWIIGEGVEWDTIWSVWDDIWSRLRLCDRWFTWETFSKFPTRIN